jgi:hypothetical protein
LARHVNRAPAVRGQEVSPSARALALFGLLLASSARAAPDAAHATSPSRERARDDDESLATATPDPTPEVPSVLEHAPRASRVTVNEQAGVGGPLAYASATVLEVGGSGSLNVAGDQLFMRMAPTVGWFVLDGLQLSYTHEIYFAKHAAEHRLATAVLIGGSAHFRINDRLLVATGADCGALYNGEQWGVEAKPTFTLDILVGRSAVLHPGVSLAWSSVDAIDAAGSRFAGEHLLFGFTIGYGAMF